MEHKITITGKRDDLEKLLRFLMNCPACNGKKRAMNRILDTGEPVKFEKDDEEGYLIVTDDNEFHVRGIK